MEINRAAFGALAVIGVVAAGGGAYLANRHNRAGRDATRNALLRRLRAGAVTETENSIAAAPATTVQRVEPAPPVLRDEPGRERPASGRRSPHAAPVRAPARALRERAVARRSQPAAVLRRRRPRRSIAPVTAAIEPLESTTVERAPAVPEAPRKMYDELVIPADSVIGLQVENAVSSERAKVEDTVRARVTRDVRGSGSRRDSGGRRRRGFDYARRARRTVEGSGAPRHPVPHDRAGGRDAAADQHGDDLSRR